MGFKKRRLRCAMPSCDEAPTQSVREWLGEMGWSKPIDVCSPHAARIRAMSPGSV